MRKARIRPKTFEEKIYISDGNTKVKCPILSMPTKITCKPGLECVGYCYSDQAEVQYDNCLPSRIRNLSCSKDPRFVETMISKIHRRKSSYFRIHEGGDFYSKEYIDKWYSIIRKCPDKIFFAFTKRDDLFTRNSLSRKPPNLVLIYSFDKIDTKEDHTPYLKKGFDKVAYVTTSTTNCPALKDKKIKCIRHCRACPTKGTKIIIKFWKH